MSKEKAESSEEYSIAFGMLSLGEVETIKKYVKPLPKNAVVVNIGAGFGTSGLAIVEQRPDLTETTYTIDIETTDTPFGGLGNERNAFENSGKKLINQVLGNSLDVVKWWDRKIDLLLVDGCHNYEEALSDMIGFGAFLKYGCHMLCHDNDMSGVIQAISELPSMFAQVEVSRKMTVFRKQEPIKRNVHLSSRLR